MYNVGRVVEEEDFKEEDGESQNLLEMSPYMHNMAAGQPSDLLKFRKKQGRAI
jgi:hypothetical protein